MKHNAEKRLTAKRKDRQQRAYAKFKENIRKSQNFLMIERFEKTPFSLLTEASKRRIMEAYA